MCSRERIEKILANILAQLGLTLADAAVARPHVAMNHDEVTVAHQTGHPALGGNVASASAVPAILALQMESDGAETMLHARQLWEEVAQRVQHDERWLPPPEVLEV